MHTVQINLLMDIPRSVTQNKPFAVFALKTQNNIIQLNWNFQQNFSDYLTFS